MQESQFLSAFILQYRKSETPPSDEEREEERSAIDVMHQIEQILPELYDGDLKTLLDPRVVLVLAGYKPKTFLFKGPLQTSSEIFGRHKIDILYGMPISLIAARNRLRESKLIQILCKNVKIGPPVSVLEYDEFEDIIHRETNNIFAPHSNISTIIYDGITLGYPDLAILDFATAYYKDHQSGVTYKHRNRLIPAGIIEGNNKLKHILNNYAVPDFDVSPEHANEPSVVSASTKQRKFLEEFYSLPPVISMLESVGVRKE